jgi:hypothetical protein
VDAKKAIYYTELEQWILSDSVSWIAFE